MVVVRKGCTCVFVWCGVVCVCVMDVCIYKKKTICDNKKYIIIILKG